MFPHIWKYWIESMAGFAAELEIRAAKCPASVSQVLPGAERWRACLSRVWAEVAEGQKSKSA
jgi:hypothetical protein